MYQDYSVLMSVYIKENPEYLRQSIQSMMDQTVPTNDFVLVCDGPLTTELNQIIAEFENSYADIFHVIRLEKNQGLGNALNFGLKACKNELVARMDSDDIAQPNRCQLQLQLFKKDTELVICSGNIAEFEKNPDIIKSIRTLPVTHQEILTFAKRRNPMNHMAVMYMKSKVEAVGGYIEINLAEDYYLWVRMLNQNYKAGNIDKILVKARIGNGMYQRRGGVNYAKNIYSLEKKFLDLGFISYKEFLSNCIIRITASLVPAKIREQLYLKKLRG